MTEIAKQLDFSKKTFTHPTYRFSKLLPQSGGTTTTIGQAGGNETIFEIPVNAMNLSKGFVRCQIRTPNVGAANYCKIFGDTFPLIRQLQLYTRSGRYLCDLNEVSNYLKVVWNVETKLDDFLSLHTQTYQSNVPLGDATATPARIGDGPLFFRNNSATNAAAAQRPTRAANGSDIAYTEPMYAMNGTVGNAAVVGPPAVAAGVNSISVVNCTLPLSMLYNTIFAVDKDLWLGEIVLMRIVWQPYVKVYYIGTGAADADAGAAAANADVSVGSLALFMAIEKNQDIVNQLQSQASSGGLNILVPYTYTYKTNIGASVSQNVSLRFNRGNGRKLKKIYHSLFHNTESSNTAYDHSNYQAGRVSTYYTLLNNNRMQEYNIDCTAMDDYYLIKDKLAGSVIQDSGIFRYNWFHLEDFTGIYDSDEDMKDNLSVGLPLELEQKWDAYFTTAGLAYNHYSFAICEKMLTVGPQGIEIL